MGKHTLRHLAYGFTLLLVIVVAGVARAAPEHDDADNAAYRKGVTPVALYFDNVVSDWKTTLLHLLEHPVIEHYVLALNHSSVARIESQKKQMEQLFSDLTRSSLNAITSIRFTDAEGEDKVIVVDGIASTDYRQRIGAEVFRQAMKLGDFEITPITASADNANVVELAAPVVINGLAYGVITLSINLQMLFDNLDAMLEGASHTRNTFYSSNGKLLVVAATRQNLQKDELEALAKAVNAAPATTILNNAGSEWAVIGTPQKELNFVFQLPPSKKEKSFPLWYFLIMLFLIAATVLIYKNKTQLGSIIARRVEGDTIDSRARFLANLSHEMRTPLSGLLGMLALVNDTKLNKEQSKYIGSAQKSGEWLLQLINDFLDFSKIDSGKLTLEFIDFDLRTMLDDVVELLSVQAYAKGLDIACITASTVPSRVNGDPTRLRQILMNLVGNAVKFTEKGDVAINVKQVEHPEHQLMIRFEVVDTGYGVDPEQIGEIFKPFVQGDTAVTRKYGGTGLGLAISKQLVDLMGGEIGVEENSNGGATFWFAVPFERATELTQFVPEDNLAGSKVLVAGEISVNRDIIVDTLKDWGMICDSVDRLDNTVNILVNAHKKNVPYEICIIDVSLSYSNKKAFGLVKNIRQAHRLDSVRLIMLTADGTPGDGAVAKSAGVQAYLTKPINRSQLESCLQQILRYESIRDIPLITRHRLKESTARGAVKMLVVEDNAVNQKVAVGLLAKCGYHADVASDGAQALSALKDKHYDMVFMDMQLPEKSGLEVTREFREYQRAQVTPEGAEAERTIIIALTGNAKKTDIKACLDAGMDDHLSKPFQMTSLEKKLRHWFGPLATPIDDSVFENDD